MDSLSYKINGFATHQPFLIELLKNTNGNILELGCGEGSTLLFREFISPTRHLISVESNKEWLDKYIPLQNEYHTLYHIPTNNDDTQETGQAWVDFLDKTLKNMSFDIVFIDQSPWTSRISTLKYFINRAKYIVVHDSDYFPVYKKMGKIIEEHIIGENNTRYISDFSDVSNYFHVFYPPRNYLFPLNISTLICSNITTKSEFTTMINTIEANNAKYY